MKGLGQLEGAKGQGNSRSNGHKNQSESHGCGEHFHTLRKSSTSASCKTTVLVEVHLEG